MTMTRTTHQTVTFARPFVVPGLDGAQPAGTYTVETDDELLQALSVPAYRRLETRIRVRGGSGRAGFEQVARIDPGDLDAALAKDAAGEGEAIAADRAPMLAPFVTASTSTAASGQPRLEPSGSVAVITLPTVAEGSDPRAHSASGGWLSLNRADLKLIAVMLGGFGVLGFLMSYDLPLLRGAAGP